MTPRALLVAATLALVAAGASTAASPAPLTYVAAGPEGDAAPTRVGYVLPVDGAVRRLFEAPVARWAAGHRGVDLAAEPGAAVRAPADGVVLFSGFVVDRTVLTVGHPDGRRSSLEPLAAPVAEGTLVRAGDPIGTVAASSAAGGHCGPASCVHWGVREDGSYADPLDLLDPHPVVLLP